jgi:hypothetical protein
VKRWPGWAIAVFVTAMTGGCAHGVVHELPGTPTAVTVVTVRSLTVTPVGGGSMLVGARVPITSSGPLTAAAVGAVVHYNDASSRFTEATWTTSDPAVLAVDGREITAVGRGTATLTASAEGRVASESFTVLPGIAGNWSGAFVVDQCQAGSASLSDLVCGTVPGRAGVLAPGSTTPISLQIAKSEADLSAVTVFGELRGTLAGTDRGQNRLTLLGQLASSSTALKMVHWDAGVKADVMEGFIAFEVRIAGVGSHANVTAHLANVTRR